MEGIGLRERLQFNEDFKLDWHDDKEAHDGYQLKWVGKNYARLQAGTETETVIIPDTIHNEKDINKNSNNLFFTGDNLEVLKHLQNAYAGKIKMIYIDPPYNTGGEFVYPDSFSFTDVQLKDMLGYNDEDIKRLHSINGRSSHSAWLTFMYPRLKIAKKLLTNDGIMYISIDENEVHNLMLLVSEMFQDNNLDYLIWQKTDARYDQNTNAKIIRRFKSIHEYILVCYVNKSETLLGKIKKYPEWKTSPGNPDNDPRGNWQSGIMSYEEGHQNEDRTSEYYYSITLPSGRVMTRHWFVLQNEFEELRNDNRIYFPNNGDGVPRKKTFENEEQEYKCETILRGFGTFSSAKDEIKDLFGNRDIFDTPKPQKMIKELVRCSTGKNDIILDFFAGSSSTAHAVMQLNAEDSRNRKFIMVQLPEKTKDDSEAKRAGFNTVDEISRKRIELSAERIKDETKKDIDYGFKHYYVQEAKVDTIDKIIEFNPDVIKLIADDMVSEFNNEFSKGEDVILTTWLVDDGYEIDTKVEKIKLGDYIAHYVDNQKLYLIQLGWGASQTKELLEMIGKYRLNVSSIIVYGYSFNLESLSELETNVKTNLENKITIEKRY